MQRLGPLSGRMDLAQVSWSPAISVLLPVFNAEAYVRDAVESILTQSFADFELIIINDGSTDGSNRILRDLAAQDQRVILVERSNGGLVSALNEGVALARADFVARMDADDIAMPERFALQYARISAEPSLGVLGSFTRIINREGELIRIGDYPVTVEEVADFIEMGSPVAHPAVMIRRDALIATAGYRQAFAHCEDYDLWLRISERGYGIANLPVPLLQYRMHGGNISAVHSEAQAVATLIARSAHRSRMLGLGDPTATLKQVGLDTLHKFASPIRSHFEPELFGLKYANISLENREALQSAWSEYKTLGKATVQHPATTAFVLRVVRGSVVNFAPALLVQAVTAALRHHPWYAASLVARKIRRSLAALHAKRR
jgi:glycosyltransferase involved in cell wall biosynthesis